MVCAQLVGCDHLVRRHAPAWAPFAVLCPVCFYRSCSACLLGAAVFGPSDAVRLLARVDDGAPCGFVYGAACALAECSTVEAGPQWHAHQPQVRVRPACLRALSSKRIVLTGSNARDEVEKLRVGREPFLAVSQQARELRVPLHFELGSATFSRQ